MRLLILNWRDLQHPRAGGSEVYAQNLARCWAATGHDVTVFSASVPGLPEQSVQDGYTLIRRGGRLSVYGQARRFYEAQGAGRFDSVLDVVNTRPFMTPKWVHDSKAVALIYQVADDVWPYEVPWPAHLLGRYYLEPRWLKVYSRSPVLTISESSRESLRRYGLTDVTVVPVGVDPPLARPLPPKETVPTITFVGRMSANKRPDHAIAAHAYLKTKLPEAQLWMVGDGPLAGRLRKIAGPGVTFFGRVDAATKQDLMASAHSVVCTSVREGWGMTVSEAARLGTRAVGYDVPGLRDSVPVADGVLTEATPAALADALAQVLPAWIREPRPQLGAAGVVGWEDVAHRILNVLESP